MADPPEGLFRPPGPIPRASKPAGPRRGLELCISNRSPADTGTGSARTLRIASVEVWPEQGCPGCDQTRCPPPRGTEAAAAGLTWLTSELESLWPCAPVEMRLGLLISSPSSCSYICQSAFHSCDKMPELIGLIKEKGLHRLRGLEVLGRGALGLWWNRTT